MAVTPKPRPSGRRGMAGCITPSTCRRPTRNTSRAPGKSRTARTRPARPRPNVRPVRPWRRAAAPRRPATTRPGYREPATDRYRFAANRPPFARRIQRVNQPLPGLRVRYWRKVPRDGLGDSMGRLRLLIATAALAGAAAASLPAVAQFGTIFGGPPRPPADVPGGAANDDDRYYSTRSNPSPWTRQPQVVSPPPQGYPQQGYPQQGYPP